MLARSKLLVPLGVFALVATSSKFAAAYVPTPVGGHPGEADVHVRATFERGVTEPHADPASVQPAHFDVYEVGGGYTFGDLGPIQDIRLGLDFARFTADAEVNDPSKGLVPPGRCAGVSLDAGRCEFHPANSGELITPRLSFNVYHSNGTSLGFYLQSTIPIDIDIRRFALPRLDLVAVGMVFGTRLRPWLTLSSNTYLGSGYAFASTGSRGEPSSTPNGAVAQTLLLGFEADRWLLPWKIGIQTGTFFEGDLRDRYDVRYDTAYPSPYGRERIRAFRFALAFLPYVQVTERAAIEAGYIQKFFGYDAVDTKTFYIGARAAF